MSNTHLLSMLRRGRAASSGGGGGSSVLFEDDFSSGDFSKTQNGCAWVSNTWCTVESVPSYISPVGKAARFNLGGPTPDRISELDWELDQDYPEIFTKHLVYLPSGAESPSVGPKVELNNAIGSGGANKLFRVYPKAGNIAGDPRFGAQTKDDGGGDAAWNMWAGVYMDGSTSELGTNGLQATEGVNNARTPFINASTRGTLVTIEQRAKRSTSSTSPDGELQLWINDVSIYNITGIKMYHPSQGYGGGYLFGAQDSGWLSNNTYVYVPYFGVSVTGRVP